MMDKYWSFSPLYVDTWRANNTYYFVYFNAWTLVGNYTLLLMNALLYVCDLYVDKWIWWEIACF